MARSLGIVVIMVLFMLFAGGILFVITNQVMTNEILPISNDLIDGSNAINDTAKEEIKSSNDKYMNYWKSIPFIIVFIAVLYMLIASFTRRGDEYEYR